MKPLSKLFVVTLAMIVSSIMVAVGQDVKSFDLSKYSGGLNQLTMNLSGFNLDERTKAILSMECPTYWDFKKGGLDGNGLLKAWAYIEMYKSLAENPYLLALGGLDTQFYESTHKKYSGYSGNSFAENRSKTAANLAIYRIARVGEQTARLKDATATRDTVTPVFEEHIYLLGDRTIDKHYLSYKEEFEGLHSDISNTLLSAMALGGGKFSTEINLVQERLKVVTEKIKYLHKTGLDGSDLESSQRQAGYEECLDELKGISIQALKIKLSIKYMCNFDN